MKYNLKTSGIAVLLGALTGTGFVVSCGSSNDSSSAVATKAATLDVASVTAGVPEISAFLPVCTTTKASGVTADAPVTKMPSLGQVLALGNTQQVLAGGRSLKTVTSKPADALGNCGGKRTYTSFSHVSGVTTASVTYENYCSLDASTGVKKITNGSYSFVDTGTPTASGPVTNKIDANSPAGLSYVTQDSSGKVLTSQLFAFTNFNYTVGVPGGKATAAKPNSYGFADLSVTDQVTKKTYRQTNYLVSFFDTAAGGQQSTVSGRGYRSGGDYYDMSTTVPVVTDAAGNTLAGEVSIQGATGSAAVATFVPGAVTQVTIKVNGTPVTGVPGCKTPV